MTQMLTRVLVLRRVFLIAQLLALLVG
jgi:hypothetical protein